ncbi:MAG: hypothetical protein U0169_15130 [Polyangiaceae bacterium]
MELDRGARNGGGRGAAFARHAVVLLACSWVTGCVLFVNDDPGALRAGGKGASGDASAGSEGTTSSGGSDSGTTGTAPGEIIPDGTPACLPPFMKTTGTSCASCLAFKCKSQFDACCADPACRDAKRFTTTKLLTAIDDCLSNDCGERCIGRECHVGQGICSCLAQSPLPTDTECTVTTIPDSICCASFDWPADGTCECSQRGECPNGLKLLSHCT